MITTRRCRQAPQRGGSIIEVTLMAPWIFFLFVGVLDFGFYSYAAVATQNAARVAALHTSSSQKRVSDAGTACFYALEELRWTPNIKSMVNTCAVTPAGVSSSLPVAVTAGPVTGADGAPAAEVSVTYQSVPLIPIPGIVPKQITLTRVAQMRVNGN
jgi:Flp pilus assembly protein TadG